MKLKNNYSNFVPAPTGVHRAVLVDVQDIGLMPGMGGKMVPKLNLVFELTDALMEDGRPFIISRRFTASLAETAHLAQFIAKWRGGVPIRYGEEIDLESMIGKSALLVIVRNPPKPDGKVFANIDSVLPCPDTLVISGHFQRKGTPPGSAAPKPTPVAQPVGIQARRTAIPSTALPTTAELGLARPPVVTAPSNSVAVASGPVASGPVATPDQIQKFMALLAPITPQALKYFQSIGALANDQSLANLPPQFCPATQTQFANTMASIEAFVDSMTEDDVPF